MKIGLKNLVAKGIIWNGIQLVVNICFTFGVRLLLAKLLLPTQFGLIGMAVVVTGFVQVLNDIGISAALIQKKEEKVTNLHFQTAFWSGLIYSILLYLIVIIIIAPQATLFYNEPELKELIPFISLGIIIGQLNIIPKTILTKQLNFKRIAVIENISNILSGILAIVLALNNFGVWALAVHSITTIVFATPLYYISTKWKPELKWDRNIFNEILNFGLYTNATNILNYSMNNVDYLLIGKLLGQGLLGAYTFSFTLTDVFRGKMMAVVNNVMYPVYGKIQSEPLSIKKYYLKVIEYNSLIIYPIMIIFISIGDTVITEIFGTKWSESIEPLKILSISVMVHMLVNSNTSLIRGLGKPKLETKLQLIKAAINIPILILLTITNGIIGTAIAVLINKCIAVLIAQYTFNNLLNININAIELMLAIKNPLIAGITMYITGTICNQIMGNAYIQIICLMGLSYIIVISILMKETISKELNQVKLFKL